MVRDGRLTTDVRPRPDFYNARDAVRPAPPGLTPPAPRPVDRRPSALRRHDGVYVLPGGHSRFAVEEGSMLVNSALGGGAKDTWILG